MIDDLLDNNDWLWDDAPQGGYAQIAVTVAGRAPLLTGERLPRLIIAAIGSCQDAVPGTLWAYTVLPDSVRFVLGPASSEALDHFVTQFKADARARLLSAIQRADDDSLDMVLRFNPVWGGAIYRVWDAGYHRVMFSTEYRLSNAIYTLAQLPVERGLSADSHKWPFTWTGGDLQAG